MCAKATAATSPPTGATPLRRLPKIILGEMRPRQELKMATLLRSWTLKEVYLKVKPGLSAQDFAFSLIQWGNDRKRKRWAGTQVLNFCSLYFDADPRTYWVLIWLVTLLGSCSVLLMFLFKKEAVKGTLLVFQTPNLVLCCHIP